MPAKSQRRIIAAWTGTGLAQADAPAARKQWDDVADQARPRLPKLAALMDETDDVLTYMGIPPRQPGQVAQHSQCAASSTSSTAQPVIAQRRP